MCEILSHSCIIKDIRFCLVSIFYFINIFNNNKYFTIKDNKLIKDNKIVWEVERGREKGEGMRMKRYT